MNNIDHVEDNKGPEEVQEGVAYADLTQQLDAQIEYFDKLPQHEKFSFCLNCDLAYFMLLVANILKKGFDELHNKNGHLPKMQD